MAVPEAPSDSGLDAAVDDSGFFTSGTVHQVCRELRDKDPVHWHERLGAWLVTRYDDVKYISKTPELFSSEKALVINDIKYEESWTAKFWPEGADNLIMTDPPKHREMRRIINNAFTRQRVESLRPSIRALAHDLIAQLPGDETVDIVPTVATPFPLLVVCQLMGWSTDNWKQLGKWSDLIDLMSEDPDEETVLAAVAELQNLFNFVKESIDARREAPSDDLISTLLAGTVDGEQLSEINLVLFGNLLLTAGNETNRNLISGGMITLAEHPDQLTRLAADPTLVPLAVDEMLRFAGPINQFLRTATKDCDLSGKTIKAGDPLVLLYVSANRDERIWDDPDRFDVARVPQPGHLAFGWGEHVCPGASLARLSVTVFFEELFKRFSGWEIVGPIDRRPATTINSIDSLPVRLTARL